MVTRTGRSIEPSQCIASPRRCHHTSPFRGEVNLAHDDTDEGRPCPEESTRRPTGLERTIFLRSSSGRRPVVWPVASLGRSAVPDRACPCRGSTAVGSGEILGHGRQPTGSPIEPGCRITTARSPRLARVGPGSSGGGAPDPGSALSASLHDQGTSGWLARDQHLHRRPPGRDPRRGLGRERRAAGPYPRHAG